MGGLAPACRAFLDPEKVSTCGRPLQQLVNNASVASSEHGHCWPLDHAILCGSIDVASALLGNGARLCPGRPVGPSAHENPHAAAMKYASGDKAEQLNVLLFVDDQRPKH